MKARKFILVYLLFFIITTCFGQSKKTLMVVDKQKIINSSLELKEIEKYLEVTWDSLDHVMQLWIGDFQKQCKNRPHHTPSPSEDQIKLMQEHLNQEQQAMIEVTKFRSDTCRMVAEEINALAFDKILEDFNQENTFQNIEVIDKSQVLYFEENLDLTEVLEQFVLSKMPPKDIRNNSLFDACQTIFKKYKIAEKLSLKCMLDFNN